MLLAPLLLSSAALSSPAPARAEDRPLGGEVAGLGDPRRHPSPVQGGGGGGGGGRARGASLHWRVSSPSPVRERLAPVRGVDGGDDAVQVHAGLDPRPVPGGGGGGGGGLPSPAPLRPGRRAGGLEWRARRGRCPRPGRSRRPWSGACRARTSCGSGSTRRRRGRGPSKASTASPPRCASSTRAACSPSGTRPSCRSSSPSSTTRYGRTRRRSR